MYLMHMRVSKLNDGCKDRDPGGGDGSPVQKLDEQQRKEVCQTSEMASGKSSHLPVESGQPPCSPGV